MDWANANTKPRDDEVSTGAILFVTREPVTRERNGSTAAVNNLLTLLRDHGARVTVLVTTGASRSPRLLFRELFPLPAGCVLRVPGYLRVGGWYVRPFDVLAWMRAAVRGMDGVPWLQGLRQIVQRLAGDRLYGNSWDLTVPTAAERALVLQTVRATRPQTVIANYAFWGPALAQVQGVHRAILMHDLLAEHVRLFREAGLPLDCPDISAEREYSWLNAADTVIAIQNQEAETVRARVHGTVLVQPVRLPARNASPDPMPGRCLLVASNSTPNLQGLTWLLREIWPRVRAEVPQATLVVAGTVRDRWTGNVPTGVSLLGSVESLEAEYDRASVCMVPLLVGSGLKIKLLEALSHGKATVSTTVGVQGLEQGADGAIAVADVPEQFAAAILALLRDEELRRTREQAATALVRERFSAGSADETALLTRLMTR